VTYQAQGHVIDLSRLTRLYPAAVVNAAGETAQVSLEWAELKAEQVPVAGYVLVFDTDPLGDVPKNRIELFYETREALDDAMRDVASLLNA